MFGTSREVGVKSLIGLGLVAWAVALPAMAELPAPYVSPELNVTGLVKQGWSTEKPEECEYRTLLVAGDTTFLTLHMRSCVVNIYHSDGTLKRDGIEAIPSEDCYGIITAVFLNGKYLVLGYDGQGNGTIQIGEDGELSSRPSLSGGLYATAASAGSSGILVWERSVLDAWDIYGSLLDSNGNPQTPEGTLLGRSSNVIYEGHLSIAAGANGYLVAWCDCVHEGISHDCEVPGPLHLVLLDEEGQPKSERIIEGVQRARVSFDGNSYLVAWSADGKGVNARRLNPDGTWMEPAPFLVSNSDSVCFGLASREDESVLLLTNNAPEAVAYFMGPTGGVREQVEVASYWDVYDYASLANAQVVASRDRYFGGWNIGAEAYNRERYYSREGAVFTAEEVGEPMPIFLNRAKIALETAPRIAYNADSFLVPGPSYLVAWWMETDSFPRLCGETRDGCTYALTGVFLDPKGEVRDPPGLFTITESTTEWLVSPGLPTLAAAYNNFLVVWTEDFKALGATITADGDVLPQGGVGLPYDYDELTRTLSFDGQNFLMGYSPGRLYEAIRISPDLDILYRFPAILTEESCPHNDLVSLECLGDLCIFSYLDLNFSLKAVRVGDDNAVLDREPLFLLPAFDVRPEGLDSDALDDNSFVLAVTFEHEPGLLLGINVDGTIFPPGGIALTPPFLEGTDSGEEVAVLSDQVLVLSWTSRDTDPEVRTQVTAFRTTKALEPLDQERQPLWTAEDDTALDMAAGPGNQALVAYINSEKSLGLRRITLCGLDQDACDGGAVDASVPDISPPPDITPDRVRPDWQRPDWVNGDYIRSDLSPDIALDQALDLPPKTDLHPKPRPDAPPLDGPSPEDIAPEADLPLDALPEAGPMDLTMPDLPLDQAQDSDPDLRPRLDTPAPWDGPDGPALDASAPAAGCGCMLLVP